MNKDLHNIDDLFKNSIEDHAEEAPPDVWKNIDHGLDKKQAAFYKRKYFAVRAAAIFLVLTGGITIAAILHFRRHEKSSLEPSGQNQVVTSNKNQNTTTKENAVQNQKPNDGLVEKNLSKENTVTNNNQSTRSNSLPGNGTVTIKKINSKQYHSTNSSVDAAQKGEEVVVAKKSGKQKEITNLSPVRKNPLNLIAGEQDKSGEKNIRQQANSKTDEVESIAIERTDHIDGGTPGITDFTTTIPSVGLDKPIISVPATSLPTAKKAKSKTYLSGWTISPAYAQNINLNTLKDDDRFRDPRNNSREAERTEQETKSFSTGLGIQKQINNNIVVQTGAHYFSSERDIQPKTIFARPDSRGDIRYQFGCSSGDSYISTKNGAVPAIGDSIKTNYSRSMLSYLQVPVMVSYKINFGKFSFMPSAGFRTNFLLSGKLNSSLIQSSGEEQVSTDIDGLRSLYFSGIIQPQFNYRISDRISFDLNPNINFSLSPINKGTAVKTYQNMVSLGAGLLIKL